MFNVSGADNALVSVAIALVLRFCAVSGAVPTMAVLLVVIATIHLSLRTDRRLGVPIRSCYVAAFCRPMVRGNRRRCLPRRWIHSMNRLTIGYHRACPFDASSANPLLRNRGVRLMTYLVAADLPTAPAGERFRALLARPGILQMPGAHNGMAALQAKAAGFEALYLSGAAMTASMGLPDLGIITVEEVTFFIRQVSRASGLPVLVDGDTGYGEALNVMHMVRTFEDAGAAAVHLEDQILPKKCGHLNDKKLATPEDMAAKVAAAAHARRHLYIIARTDAAASEGMDGAVARAKLYLQAGADAIFPEAMTSAEMFTEFARRVNAPLLANMTE